MALTRLADADADTVPIGLLDVLASLPADNFIEFQFAVAFSFQILRLGPEWKRRGAIKVHCFGNQRGGVCIFDEECTGCSAGHEQVQSSFGFISRRSQASEKQDELSTANGRNHQIRLTDTGGHWPGKH